MHVLRKSIILNFYTFLAFTTLSRNNDINLGFFIPGNYYFDYCSINIDFSTMKLYSSNFLKNSASFEYNIVYIVRTNID